MWTKLSIKNFRLLRDVSIDFEPGKPVVLIGPNSSGKSSLLQVLGLLHRCAAVGYEAARGELRDFVSPSSDDSDIEVRFRMEKDSFDGRVFTNIGEEVALRYELMTDPFHVEEALYRIAQNGTETYVIFNQPLSGELKLNNRQTNAFDVVENKQQRLTFESVRHPQFYPYLGVLHETFLGIRSYSGFLTTPLWERDAAEAKVSVADGAPLAPAATLERRGLNLVNVLYHLKNSDGSGVWEELLHAFQAEFPFVKDLVFPAERGGKISIGWWDSRYPKHAFSAYDMSEGMLTYLCLLAAILSPAPTTALVFDEPDRNLHPSALRRVVGLLERASEKMAVVIATHSDRLLDALTDPAESIRVCTPTDQGVRIEKLDREALEAWRGRYSMSELRARGHLDPSNTDLELPDS